LLVVSVEKRRAGATVGGCEGLVGGYAGRRGPVFEYLKF